MRLLPRNRRTRAGARDPLARLRRRFALGAAVGATVFTAAFVLNIFGHSPGDDTAILGVEMAAIGTGTLCGVAATVLWAVTLSTEHALSIWKVAAGTDITGHTYGGDDPLPQADATPIGYGRTVRQRRRDGRIAG
jgi:hypothetical protein